jgi:hypothetical protein
MEKLTSIEPGNWRKWHLRQFGTRGNSFTIDAGKPFSTKQND